MFCVALPDAVLAEAVKAARLSSSFLRAAPPELYLMYTPKSRTYHTTSIVDVGAVPLSRAVFYLRTYVSGGSDVGALIGLGEPKSVDRAQEIVSKVRARAAQDAPPPVQESLQTPGSAKGPPLQYIVLPSIDPYAGNILPLLLEQYPHAQVVCSSFVAAFLTDKTFFGGVCRALADGDVPPTQKLVFAATDSSRIVDVADGSSVALVASADAAAPEQSIRSLKFVLGDMTARLSRRPRSQLPFMNHDGFLVYDSCSKSVFAGDMCGVRFPWLRFAHDAANPSTVLPVPPPLTQSLRSDAASPLLLPWDVAESTAVAISALRRLPLAQRVLGSSYGELAIDRTEMIEKLEASQTALLAIAKRTEEFAGKGGDPAKLAEAVKGKMQSTMLLTQTSSSPASEETRSASLAFLDDFVLGHASRCIVRAALRSSSKEPSAAPSPPSPSSRNERSLSSAAPGSKASATSPADKKEKHEVDPPVDLEKLVKAFSISQLPRGFAEIAKNERIDLDVFCEMNKEELQQVFEPSFGDMKRLLSLQAFIREKRATASGANSNDVKK
jgi:hypothetical protein